MAQTKEQVKTPEKELSDTEISHLSDAEIKTLVIRMLTEIVQYRRKIEEEMKAMQSKIKKIYREPTVKERKPGLKAMVLEHKEEINIQPELNEDTRNQKSEERLRNLWDKFKHPNIQIIGVPEGEEEEQEIENLLEKIMKGNFPNLAKEIDFQEV